MTEAAAGAGGNAGAGDGAAAGAAGAGAGAAAPETPWHGIPATDAEGTAWITNKGWKTPADAVKGYRGVEALVGRDPSTLLVMPRADDPAGLRAAMARFGLPETADKYEFAKPPEGLTPDAGYEAWARSTFHEVGIPAPMVKALTAKHNEYVAAQLAKQESDYNVQVGIDKKALLSEWGGGHERMMNAAQTAAKALGFDAKMIDAIEKEKGYAGTWKFFADLGKKMGEDGFVTGADKGGQFGAALTPAEAKAEWEKMKLDPTTLAALNDKQHPGNKAAVAKKSSLFSIMYPEK